MCLMLNGFAYINFKHMSFSASNNVYYYRYCGCPRVCVSVLSFLSPHACRLQNIGTYVFIVTWNTLLYIIIVIFTKNASFRSYIIICLPRMFTILTKNASFRSYSTFVYLLRGHILNINMHTYITSAHLHELSRCVRADVYNLILIFASYYYASWPWPCNVYDL